MRSKVITTRNPLDSGLGGEWKILHWYRSQKASIAGMVLKIDSDSKDFLHGLEVIGLCALKDLFLW